jgi:very-short-patch-repair endonuclease
MTLPEVLLWTALRTRPGGMKFRHQHPAGGYVLDFFCARMRLAIEVDGEAHGRGDQPAKDQVRDAWLAREGVRVLRIPAQAVLDDVAAVVAYIVASVTPTSPSTALRAVPLPVPGRNF